MAENKAENLYATRDETVTQQFIDTLRRSEHLEPEKALAAAILEDAIHEYRKYRRAQHATGKARFREAEHWLLHPGNGWIFSFENVCGLLGLDPEYIRRELRKDMGNPMEKENPVQHSGMRKRAA